ncbi:MAG: diaminopimelate epimerase [Nitrospirae bacterium]|nr:diaminopimelate epimerase [Nitrospirota bacterium]
MAELEFVKMQGTGNDFVFLDARRKRLSNPSLVAGRLCDRRFGIGADQMLLLEASRQADFRMRIFNPDGSEVEQCGNGVRCLARYVWERGLSRKPTLSILTGGGIVKTRRVGREVEVDMGEPVLEGEKIPVAASGRIVNRPLEVDGREFSITAVSMGNPHCVIFRRLNGEDPVERYGSKIEHHPFFPKRTNVEFVNVVGPARIRVDVWERGTGRTLSCGTGACASVVAGVLLDKIGRNCEVILPGGRLHVRWDPRTNHVLMRGPAEEVFTGRVRL